MNISHFVGLSGVGGVQRNFAEYINCEYELGSSIRHKIYTLGDADPQYVMPIKVHNIRKIANLFALIIDVVSKHKITHFYNNLTSLKLVIFLFFLPSRKLILHERGTVWNIGSKRAVLLRFVVWKASLVLANSHATKVMLVKKFAVQEKKVRVIHNGINISVMSDVQVPLRKKSVFVVGFIGRLDTPKGVHVLIDAMSYLNDKNIKLVIAGDGVLEKMLKSQARGFENISFIGRVENPYKFMVGLDLLVVPSIREPLGNVCLEAGLCQVPVIASNVDGIPEIIEDQVSGELLNPSQVVDLDMSGSAVPLPEYVVNPSTHALCKPMQLDALQLSNKIIELRNRPNVLIKYAECLHKRVVEYFSIQRYSSELKMLYKNLELL